MQSPTLSSGVWPDYGLAQDPSSHDLEPSNNPIGKLFAQPQEYCDCGARVFEYYTCRNCGASYLRAYTDNLEDPSYLWHESGETFASVTGAVHGILPLDVLLETASDGHRVRPAELDLETGRLNPTEDSGRTRLVYLPEHLPTATGDDEDEVEHTDPNTGNFAHAESVVKGDHSAGPQSKIIKPRATSHSKPSLPVN